MTTSRRRPPECPQRGDLLSLLSEACEVEHALACSYLFAAFSLEGSAGEEHRLEWSQAQRVKLWAGQLYFVASQEMLHLAQLWNILNAVGGTPYYGRPVFPVDRDYFPVGAPLTLEKFSVPTLRRFCRWEQPATPAATTGRRGRRIGGAKGKRPRRPAGSRSHRTIGELYGAILQRLRATEEGALLIGDPAHQVDRRLVGFPTLRPLTTRQDLEATVEEIRDQGEGSTENRHDCHFGIFADLLDALVAERGFEPARNVVRNPVRRPSVGSTNGSSVRNSDALAAMGLFDDIYTLALRMLAWVFGPLDSRLPSVAACATGALQLMTVVIKPLGEAITLLPADKSGKSGKSGDLRAGPSFAVGRHLPLPLDPAVTVQLVRESLTDCVGRAELLAKVPRLAVALSGLPGALGRIREAIQ